MHFFRAHPGALEALESLVGEQVSQRGCGTSSEYVRESIRKDQDRPRLGGLLPAGAAQDRRPRAWPLTRYPHIVVYVERPDHIDVLRVLHGQRDLPACVQEPGNV